MSNTNETIDKIAGELRKMKSSLNRDSTILLVIAVILFAVLLGYFILGYNKFKELSEPNYLMDVAEDIVKTNIAEARKHLENEVSQNADVWAQQLSDQAVDTVDDMRLELEKFVQQQLEDKIAESVDLASPEFEKVLTENNGVLKKAFADFGSNNKTAEELVDVIAKEVDDRLKTNLQTDANEVLNMMVSLTDKLKKLKTGQNLSAEEQLEMQILKTARLIQSQSKSE